MKRAEQKKETGAVEKRNAKILGLASRIDALSSSAPRAFGDAVSVLEAIVGGEEAYQQAGGLDGDVRDAATHLAALQDADILASPSLRRQVGSWRRMIREDPARGHYGFGGRPAAGQKLRALLAALDPSPARGEGRHPRPSAAALKHDRDLLKLGDYMEFVLRDAVRDALKEGRIDVGGYPIPPNTYVYVDHGNADLLSKNWYGERVPAFHQEAASYVDRILLSHRQGDARSQCVAAWLFKFEHGQERVRLRDAVKWMRALESRVRRWDGRTPQT